MRKIAIAAAAAFTLVVTAAACGGGGSSSSPPAASTTAAGTTTAPAPPPGKAGGTLNGFVGPGFTISLFRGSQDVTTLKAGTYTFVIKDEATIHGFTLRKGSASVRDLSGVGFLGTSRVKVKLTKGQWTFFCPIHQSQMNGTFTVQ
jgi:hypothetical protein